MHEASLVRGLLHSVESLLREHNAARATQVNVTIGEFSGVEPDLLELAFARQVRDTAAKGARLCVTRSRLTGRCDRCGHEFPIERFCFVCSQCQANNVTVISGEELLLESVIMEMDE